MSPQEWAARYLAANREGGRMDAVLIDRDAGYDLDRDGRREYARLIKEDK